MYLNVKKRLEYFDFIKKIIESKKGVLDPGCVYKGSFNKIGVTCSNGHRWEVAPVSLKRGKWCPDCAGQKTCEKDVRKFIEDKGGRLDPDWKYVNNKTTFNVQCTKGHIWKANWVSLKLNVTWCPYCSGVAILPEKVRKFIEDKGGKLDPNWKYVNNHLKFTVKCSKGHNWKTNWHSLQRNSWCPHCAGKFVSTESVVNFIKSKGGKIDPDWVYVDNSTRIFITCNKNHSWGVTWSGLQAGHWCPKCARELVGKKQIADENFVQKFIANKGGKLDPNWKYVNNRTKFWIECRKGHRWETCWSPINLGTWCPHCAGKFVDEKDVIRLIESKEGKLPENWAYKTAKTKFDVHCAKGHTWTTDWTSIKSDKWCPHCRDTKSEKSFRETMERIFSVPFPKTRPQWLINPETNRRLELDGYSEEKALAFEYQGPLHYDGNRYSKIRNPEKQKIRDAVKVQLCKENGIQLLIIPFWVPQTEWEAEINKLNLA